MNRKLTAAAMAALTAAGLATAVALTPSATAGQTAPAAVGADAASPEMLSAMARDLKLTPDQARQRIAREHKASSTEQALRGSLGNAFGGAWLDAGANTLTVALTDPAKADQVRGLGAVPKVVARSQAALDSAKAKLDAHGKAPQSVPGWYVDVNTNAVVVLAKAGGQDAAKAWAKSAGLDAAAVRVETSTEAPRPLIDVIGGNAYNFGGGSRCSIGFSVEGGFVTAGHCGTVGTQTSNPSGSVAGSSFPGNDYGYVRVAAGNTPRPLVNRYSGGQNVSVEGSTEAAVGASVCRSGSTTGWHCGTIQQKNASVNYQEGTVSGLTRTNACAEPGDSGGSWLAGAQAQGVTSGGSGNCSQGGTFYFQPVNEILQAYGLRLLTSGGNPPGSTTTTTPGNPPGGTSWAPYTNYAAGATVTYSGVTYRAIQGHTSLPGWEPPNVPSLWGRA
ncbi:alpha-lytic protease prodomain-containing protein [Actinokineospora auranticolor]|uniref:Streptogrisin C n=1 Tax=Actinokineospora auranticolor TaxID=155976 RepID=A0A2S6GUY8_9PSEU|nr:alpha-lytic protease prodomain-containing protein [Actinokineospora auranticolor]PPK69038.1 streptogrisin C [Actinokineospora auranticolor]